MDLSSWVTAIATALLALITFFYVRLTKRLLDAQTDPYIVVSTIHDTNRPTIIQLVIKNIGTGFARDITFQCSQPLPRFAWGLTISDAKDAEIMTAGPLIDGISGLAPGEERRIDWGQYGGLMKALGNDPVFITANFKKNEKGMPPAVSAVDVKSSKVLNAFPFHVRFRLNGKWSLTYLMFSSVTNSLKSTNCTDQTSEIFQFSVLSVRLYLSSK